MQGEPSISDALQLQLAVQRPQDAVSLATSFAVRAVADKSADWQEGLALPAAVPGSGQLAVSAGVGHLPAVLSVYQQLPDWYPEQRWPEAFPALTLVTQAPVYRAYGLELSSTQLGLLDRAAADLQALSHPAWGLMHTSPDRCVAQGR